MKDFKLYKKWFIDHYIQENGAISYIYPEGNPSLLIELPIDDVKNTSGRFEQVNHVVFDIIKAKGASANVFGITDM